MSEWYGVRPPVVRKPAPPSPDSPDADDTDGSAPVRADDAAADE